TDLDRVAHGELLFAQHAANGRGDFHRDLVGLEADEWFVDLHRVAGLLQPLADRAFGDRFTACADFAFAGQLRVPQAFFLPAASPPSFSPSAIETRQRCCSSCRLASPVAGEAATSRPA